MPRPHVVPVESSASHDPLGDLLGRCARGDIAAFEQVYDIVAGAVLGLAIRVVRDPSQAEEVAQEVLIDVWRNAARFDTARGSARAWIMTIAHRRAVDRVRHYQASSNRENRVSAQDERCDRDVVFEQVESSLEREQVRRCLDALTELQRESITLAYYDGYTYPEVATLLQTPLGTVKTRMRDGMIRLRDCMGLG